MRFSAALFGTALGLLSAGPSLAAIDAPVRTGGGLVQGVAAGDPAVTVFKGIPYAAPPVGDLRWKAPQAPAAWTGVRKADQFGALCPQAGAPEKMSEDCLTLNVWTGAAAPGERRPVLVWIYGGAFIQGTGANPEFDGEGLAKKGVIVVTFNYRLGALGFLATPELSQESGHAASGNYGLLDDIAALKWVQKNIAAFGGDPTKVTIAGQSAGAGSVGFLTQSPLAKGLFQRSIAESHARHPGDPDLRYLSVSWRALKTAEAAGAQYAQEHGATSLAELRALPWAKVIENSDRPDMAVDTGSSAKPPIFRPVIDGWVVPNTYSQMLAKGAHNDVFFIAGNNKDETGAAPETAIERLRASTAAPRPGAPTVFVRLADYQAGARQKYGAMADEFLKLYPAANDDEAALASNTAARDANRSSTFLWAQKWSKTSKKPVYTYFWTHAPPGPGHDMRGAYHGSEINYAFGNLYATNRPWTDDDHRIADVMSSYWANYIKTGNPNGAGLPTWPVFDPKAPRVMSLGDSFGPIPLAEPARLAFWKRFYESQAQW
jgi:para-nitrobenzyl esterase